MKLTSTAFEHETHIPKQYTCDGHNINPPLQISDVPDGIKSFALIVYDPDVPRDLRPDGNFDHWLVFNIPPDTREILEAHEPLGKHGMNTSGRTKYFGPCPPDKEHRYFFKLYALDTLLSLPEKSTRKEIETAMQHHILATAELMGIYGR